MPVEKLRVDMEGGKPRPHTPPCPCLSLVCPHSGWISALVVLKTNTAVAILMLLVALLFTGIAVLGIVMLKRVRGCCAGGAQGRHLGRNWTGPPLVVLRGCVLGGEKAKLQ